MTRFGLSKYGPTSFFAGDELGLFILPPTGRPWIPKHRQLATTYPVEITLRRPEGRLDLDSPPFVISVEAAPAGYAGS